MKLNFKLLIYSSLCLLSVLFPDLLRSQIVNSGLFTIEAETEVVFIDSVQNLNAGSITNDGQLYVVNHFMNNGILSYHTSGSKLLLVGENLQLLGGDGVYELDSLSIDNSNDTNAVLLKGELLIHGPVSFENGIVNISDSGSFVLMTDATVGNASDFAHVNGPVIREGQNDIVTPIGNSLYYRPMEIDYVNNAGGNNRVEVDYVLSNSELRFSHDQIENKQIQIDTNEYWELKCSNYANNIILSMGWSEWTSSELILDNLERFGLHIMRYDTVKSKWVKEESTINASNQMLTTINPVGGCGVFAIGMDREQTLTVYNAINRSSLTNNVLRVFGLENYQNNNLKIFNRWGVKVFETDNYNHDINGFIGESNAAGAYSSGDQLPTGTYFYVIEFGNGSLDQSQKGFMYLEE